MNYRISTPPTTSEILEYITLDDIKQQLGITHDAFDGRLESFVVAAYQWAEAHTGRCLLPQTVMAYTSDWREIDITRTPLRTITSITYLTDEMGEYITLSPLCYRLMQGGPLNADIRIVNPPSVAHCDDAIKIEYTAGYESKAMIPEPVKNAILMYASDLWKNRENRADLKVSLAERMLQGIRVIRM